MRPTLRALAYIVVCVVLVFFAGRIRPLDALQPVLNAAIVVGVALLLRVFLDRKPVASLGFSFRAPWLRLVVLGIVVSVAMQAAIFLIDSVAGFAHGYVRALTPVTLHALSAYAIIFALAALAEEMPFRGYLLQNLWEDWGFWPATIITALLFAGLHVGNPHARERLVLTLVVLVAYGVWAALTVRLTKSVWFALGAHFGWNFFEGPVFGFPVSGYGIAGDSLIRQTSAGPAWLTGGSYGPEGGVFALVVIVAAMVATYRLSRRESYSRRLRQN